MIKVQTHRMALKSKTAVIFKAIIVRTLALLPQGIRRSIVLFIQTLVPKDSNGLYQISKAYVHQYRNEKNHDFHTNGEYRVLRDNIENLEILFDIGANIGDWTAMALSLRNDLSIHCFEPCSESFLVLSKRDFPENVVLNNCGLGSDESELELYVFEESSGLNSLYRREGLKSYGVNTPDSTETVHVISFDSYCDRKQIEKVDFVKIDVEGHELAVLKGMRRMLENGKVGLVQFEYGGAYIDSHNLLKDVFDYFCGRKYSLYKIYPDRLQLYSEYSTEVENFQEQNWLAINEEIISAIF